MEQRFQPGDFLFFQLEAGFALIRLLAIDEIEDQTIWHVAGFHDLFPDTSSIETTIVEPASLSVAIPHVALTTRAFESTPVAEIGNSPITEHEAKLIDNWWNSSAREISDRSIRLLLGLR